MPVNASAIHVNGRRWDNAFELVFQLDLKADGMLLL